MLKGIGVSGGVGRAPALRYTQGRKLCIPDIPAKDKDAELLLFQTSLRAAYEENEQLYNQALAQAGKEAAEIIAAHNMILDDEDSFADPVKGLILTEGMNAAAAAANVLDEIIAMMETVEDEHLRERTADFKDVRMQILRHILGDKGCDISHMSSDVVLIACELSPSDTIRMDAAHVAGIVCQEGGKTSHTAILAKAMGIPAVVGCAGVLDSVCDGDMVIVDGAQGTVVIKPTEAENEEFFRRDETEKALRTALDKFRGKDSRTVDGHTVSVDANIATPEECRLAMEQDCEGVGLFRSEFLYMDRDGLPSEEEQFQAYKKTLEYAKGKTVTIRTLDAGGDKKLPGLTEPEENPFLGYRAIRICLARPEVFKTQLRALYRASAYGSLRIMFPMISSMEELRSAKAIAEEVRQELADEGISFNSKVPLGIMVEIPAVAVMADMFAAECDFFSIGTNDLTQYSLATDRGNRKVEYLYSHYHPAVLKLIANTIRCAHEKDIKCCMCGEAAGDGILIPVLLGMGLDEFSMSSTSILSARKIICESSFEDCQSLANKALSCATASEVKTLLS